MRKLCTSFFILLVSVTSISAQFNNKWFFGENAGLDFSSGSPVPISGSFINTTESCATLSDENGNLLFYSDGSSVWDRNHMLMPNGTGLLGNTSTTQGALIVKKPTCDSTYLLFTMDDIFGSNGLRYSEINLNLNNGMGDVVSTSKNTLITSLSTEKMTAVFHSNGIDVWLLVPISNSTDIHCYLVSANGVSGSPVVSSIMSYPLTLMRWQGQMKASPDGKKVALCALGGYLDAQTFENGFLDLYDFNNNTGILSNKITLMDTSEKYYGLEFSPDNSKLYILHEMSNIYQFNLSSGIPQNIIASRQLITSNADLGGMQLGPDGKIYLGSFIPSVPPSAISVINSPNLQGLACNFQLQQVSLGSSLAWQNLPSQSMVSGIITRPEVNLGNDTSICSGTSILLDCSSCNASSYEWSDGSNAAHLQVDTAGNFWVVAYSSCYYDTDTIQISQAISTPLNVNLGNDTSICGNIYITLHSDNPGAMHYWSTGDTSYFINVNAAGEYSLTVSNQCNVVTDTITIENKYDPSQTSYTIPNVFTPNNDGKNDTFFPAGSVIDGYNLQIFNRWGTKVFSTSEIGASWDGSNGNILAPAGTYFYILQNVSSCTSNEIIETKGIVTLLR